MFPFDQLEHVSKAPHEAEKLDTALVHPRIPEVVKTNGCGNNPNWTEKNSHAYDPHHGS